MFDITKNEYDQWGSIEYTSHVEGLKGYQTESKSSYPHPNTQSTQDMLA